MEPDVRDTFKTIFDKLDQLKDSHYKETSAIKDLLLQVQRDAGILKTKIEEHIKQKQIHHTEPCESLKDYKNKIWTAIIMAFIAILGAILNWIFNK